MVDYRYLASYVEPLTAEQLKEYEAVFNEVRESRLYRRFEESRNVHGLSLFINRAFALMTGSSVSELPTHLVSRESPKLAKKLVERVVSKIKKRGIADSIQERPVAEWRFKIPFTDKTISIPRKPESYVPDYVREAVEAEIESPGSFEKAYNRGVSRYNAENSSSSRRTIHFKGEPEQTPDKALERIKSKQLAGSVPSHLVDLAATEQMALGANKYERLDDTQFAASLSAAYENLVKLEHVRATDEVRREVFAEIGSVLVEAHRRYPNADDMPNKGSYFVDEEVATVEQQLMPYMREAGKDNVLLAQDVQRYEAWRDGKNTSLAQGVQEQPFNNVERYWSRSLRSISSDVQTQDFLNPYEAGKRVMNQTELQLQKEMFGKINIR